MELTNNTILLLSVANADPVMVSALPVVMFAEVELFLSTDIAFNVLYMLATILKQCDANAPMGLFYKMGNVSSSAPS